MVLTTIGFVAAIAVPRMSSASTNSKVAALAASARNLAFAMELYAAEHFDRSPLENADGSQVADPLVVIARLTQKTDDQGNVLAAGDYGPYLRQWPTNPVNGKKTLRIAAAAAGTDGWYLPPSGRRIRSDVNVAGYVAAAELD
jgi:type II secretory pathway pseudopilin PulG